MQITSSPWGKPQTQHEITPGITQVSTASHGGILVSPELFTTMPSCFQLLCSIEGTWYEEDCEINLVVLAFPGHFPDASIWAALNFLSNSRFGRDLFPSAAEYIDGPAGESLRQRRQSFIDACGHLYTRGSISSSKNGWNASFSRIRDGSTASVSDLQTDEVFGSSIFDLTRFGARVKHAPA